ncbi:MAG TPA: efflux RND transporter permease subunit [Thermoanaerobaculia bacterium]|nr:efflux RND transporter permease subunit [Thermoanaerobaculia bacterium]
MRLTDLSLRHRATVFFLTAFLVIAGVSAYVTLPRESSPDVSIPMVIVYTLWPGASPVDVESQVTRVVEREIKGIDGLKELTSVSQESASVVTVELVSGMDIDVALQKVRERVDRARPDLPADAEEPILQEINFSDFPILQVNLAGDVGPAVLKRIAEDLQDRIESIPGVLRANLVGGVEREVKVEVDPRRLQLYGLSLDDVIEAIGDENVSIPGGDLELGGLAYAVRVPGEVEDPLGVGDFVIRAEGGSPVFVRDVAEVSFGVQDPTSHARIDGRESVALAVQKRLGANIIEVADRVKEVVETAESGWPAGVEATLLGDMSKDIRQMVADLENNILSGLVLVIAVLMFVLGFRTALFVGLAIPLSMLLTFVAIQLSGTTLNMIVLFSLVLAVGMLVDNAIVVIENIYRHIEEGKPPLEAASIGTGEVGAAILVSTLTTLGAFFPLLFWPGIVGDFMFFLPLTVSIALAASLTVAFTINPVMAGTYLRVGVGERPSSRLERRLEVAGTRLAAFYERSLTLALDRRAWVVGGTVALFFLVFMLYGAVGQGVEFFPETEPNQILIDLEMPPGTRLARTDAQVRDFEARLGDIPDLEVMATGSGSGSQSDFGQEGGSGNQARLTLDLFDRKDRRQSSFLTMDLVRERTAGVPGVTVEVKRPEEGPPVGEPLSIEVRGDDFATLGSIASRITEAIADTPGLVSLASDFDVARPEIVVDVDRTEAARLGLTTRKIATTVRTAVNGTEASVHRYGDDEADVVVRLAEGARGSIEDLARLTIVSEDGDQVPLSAVATVRTDTALTSINHKDQKRVVTITGDVTSPELAEPVRQEAGARIGALENLLPPGYSVGYSGQSEDEAEAKAFLSKAFLYAVLVVLALMVAKFDSLAIPLIIITSVVMSMVGVLLGLMVTGLPFGIIMTGLGVISLAGIVVNNAIVLLDYGEQLRARGLPRRELLLTTGARRLRPVLLTAVTTILGLLPLATGVEFDFHTFAFSTGGESSQWWRGMAVAVIFGLAFATFLTLILVPVLYDLLLDFRERMARRRARRSGDGAPGDPLDESDPRTAEEGGEEAAEEGDEVGDGMAAREALPTS